MRVVLRAAHDSFAFTKDPFVMVIAAIGDLIWSFFIPYYILPMKHLMMIDRSMCMIN